ncbi:hypothetical protein BASA62_006776 [Batrachochytrium salamandrivorans]|nr:hypothetical protein BASA62_006776 [Batrachochytrium salamandrivorans]
MGLMKLSGNFQTTNLSGQGRGNDAVQAMAQDGSGSNNANFATPPDGRSDAWRFTLETVSTDTRDHGKGCWRICNVEYKVWCTTVCPYSSDPKVSRKTYQDVGRTRSVHDIGESWAIMLFEVLWNLIDKLGFEPDFTKSKSGKGNTVFMQLLIDGMKLQPCNPNFIQARDAIIQADKNNNGGAHFCEIQKGFAARGLGTGARAGNFVNSFTVDSRCS